MTISARAALPFGLNEEAHVLATAPHVLGDVDLLVACIDGVEDPRRESGLTALVGGVETLEASHGGRVGHVSLPAKSVGVLAAPELHVLSLTSVTRNAKIMGEIGTELRTAWQQPRSPVTPTLSQESWCSDIMPHTPPGSDLVPFDYSGAQVRTVLVDGEPWFVALDVCSILGIRNPSDAVRGLDDDEVGTAEVVDAAGRSQQVITISEPGLYGLLARSRRPEARPFRRWVNHEVLPTVRRTGSYSVQAAPQSQIDIIIASALEMKRMSERLEETAAAVAEIGQDSRMANARIDAIEGRHDWFSGLGYAKTYGLRTDSVSLARLGKLAATMGRSEGVEPNKVQHAHYGAVNEFPLHIWQRAVVALGGAA